MNQTIQAIQTRYKGFHFRSRTEAKWAVFFDALGVKWEYEKEGYELPSGRYLPDFWLPDIGCWIEIKPTSPSDVEKKLMEELCHGTGEVGCFGIGLPCKSPLQVFCGDISESSGGYGWWYGCHFAVGGHNAEIVAIDMGVSDRMFYNPSCLKEWTAGKPRWEVGWLPILDEAANAASSARFEFGESGAT